MTVSAAYGLFVDWTGTAPHQATTAGNLVTDAVRTASTSGDGRSVPDSSFGIWQGATPLLVTGFESGSAGWGGIIGTETVTRVGGGALFGTYRLSVSTPGGVTGEGALYSTGVAVTSGQTSTWSAWVQATTGVTLQLSWTIAGHGVQATANLVGTGNWQRVSATGTANATGTATLAVATITTAQATTFNLDGVQVESGTLATPFLGDGNTTVAGGQVQLPASLLSATQGWVAVSLRMGWPTSAPPSGNQMCAWSWHQDANNLMRGSVYYHGTYWELDQIAAAAETHVNSATDTFAAGAARLVIFAWTASQISISVGGAAFVTLARPAVPALGAQPILVGTDGTALQIDSDVFWAAFGAGTLAAADIATIAAFGQTDPLPSQLPGSCTGVWMANTAEYYLGADDISTDTLGVQCSRGRDYAATLTGRSSAGKLTAKLANLRGQYSPFNAAGPNYGNVLTGRRVQVLALYGGVPWVLWTGFIDRIDPSAKAGDIARADLQASGSLGKLTTVYPGLLPSSGALTGTLVGAVLDAAGWPAGQRAIDAGQTFTGPWYLANTPAAPRPTTLSPTRTDALSALRQLEDTEIGFLCEGADGSIRFEDRHHRLSGAALTTQATYSDAPGATLSYTATKQEDIYQQLFNDVTVTVTTYTTGTQAVLWSSPTVPVSIPPGGSQTFIAQYPNLLTGSTTAAYVVSWVTPTIGVTGGGADVLVSNVPVSSLAVSVVKAGVTMQITLTNTHATNTAMLSQVQAQGVPASQGSQVYVEATNPTSQAAYGVRSYQFPGQFLATADQAQYYASQIASQFGVANPVASVTLAANRSDATMREVLGRSVSDRVTLIAANSSQLGLNQDFFVESISHTIDAGGKRHMTTVLLSPASSITSWILGTSALGTGTVLAF